MTVDILDAALDDIYDGFCFYEKHQPGLGAYFYGAVKDEIASLESFAGIHLMVGRCHRLIMKRFPYSIYYVLDRDADNTPLFRRLSALVKDVDVLRGRIANDRVFQTVQMFFERTITLETLGEVLKAVNLGHQVCAVSNRACERIRIVDERAVSEAECANLREKSERQRQRATELTDRIVDARRRTDGIYFDELCERYRDGEGLPTC